AFAHCGILPTAASRRSLGLVSVPVWLIILSDQLLIIALILECSLGFAGSMLNRHYQIAPFDERYEQEASRKLVFSELYEASKETSNPWIFEPEYPGKSTIFDERTGNPFEHPVIIGKPYILKLIHQVEDKIHGRSSGPYALVTQ
ncbi:hypothetical protein RYX36_000422, partial [Vicia faba]